MLTLRINVGHKNVFQHKFTNVTLLLFRDLLFLLKVLLKQTDHLDSLVNYET